MKLSRIYTPACILLAVCLLSSVACAQWGRQNNTSVSVFAAMDKKSDNSGYGASYTKHGYQTTDLSYVDFGDFRMAQFSQLTPRQVGPFAANFGFTVGYADRKPDALEGPDGMVSGISLVLAQTQLTQKVSLDIRASSLTKNFNPVDWFTDPDVLWAGAGLSMKF